MIDCRLFYNTLLQSGIDFFTGVPDSLLLDFFTYLTNHVVASKHIIAANEGNAVALAVGHYLATGKIGLVYMQNSGLGNAVNPLVSLSDSMVYGVPVLLLVGWRGEPGLKDEPQHVKQGKITLQLLETLGVKYAVLPDTNKGSLDAIRVAISHMRTYSEPYALVVSKNTFAPYSSTIDNCNCYTLTREDAAAIIIDNLNPSAVIVSTTGKLSREIYEYRLKKKQGHQQDFLNVGSMGHASQIALGIALNKPDKKVYCFDGDGALLMHMGALAIIGNSAAQNYNHIVFNNGAHDSVGGQPTVGFMIDIPSVAKACGYNKAVRADTKEELITQLKELNSVNGPCLLEVRVLKGSRDGLGRPTITPQENKKAFMLYLNKKT